MTFARATNSRTTDVINLDTEWGISVSEATGRKTLGTALLAFAAYGLIFLCSVVLLPVIIGFALFPEAQGLLLEIAVISVVVILGIILHAQSKKGPKNALQLDFEASELRLGSISSAGAFVRHKVCNFTKIEEAYVDESDASAPALCLKLNGETATVRFLNASAESVGSLARKVNEARMAARAAPIRSRVQSAILGFEANAREIGNRVRSRVASRSI